MSTREVKFILDGKSHSIKVHLSVAATLRQQLETIVRDELQVCSPFHLEVMDKEGTETTLLLDNDSPARRQFFGKGVVLPPVVLVQRGAPQSAPADPSHSPNEPIVAANKGSRKSPRKSAAATPRPLAAHQAVNQCQQWQWQRGWLIAAWLLVVALLVAAAALFLQRETEINRLKEHATVVTRQLQSKTAEYSAGLLAQQEAHQSETAELHGRASALQLQKTRQETETAALHRKLQGILSVGKITSILAAKQSAANESFDDGQKGLHVNLQPDSDGRENAVAVSAETDNEAAQVNLRWVTGRHAYGRSHGLSSLTCRFVVETESFGGFSWGVGVLLAESQVQRLSRGSFEGQPGAYGFYSNSGWVSDNGVDRQLVTESFAFGSPGQEVFLTVDFVKGNLVLHAPGDRNFVIALPVDNGEMYKLNVDLRSAGRAVRLHDCDAN